MRPDKYRPLHLFLAQLPPDVVEVQLCMAELETLLGARLPVSAYWPDYWHSAGQLARRHWLPLGFSARLRRRETVVTFTRRTKPKRSAATVERLVLSATRLGRGSHRGFVEALSQRYFHGAPVLFPASVELLAVASEAVEASVALFKRRNCRTTGPLSGCVWSRRCHRRRRPGRHPSGVRGHHCRKRTRQH